jgi:hypothetical protein
MEYEFTVMLDVDMKHIASASKDRTSLFDGQFFKIGKETGETLLQWLETGSDAPKVETVTEEQTGTLRDLLNAIDANEADFCRAAKIKTLEEMPAAKYEHFHAYLLKKQPQPEAA